MRRFLGSRYELQEPIGGGGMAVVYRALDTLLARTVAVKMLRPEFAGDEEFVRRFRQEAQSAARLSHPNIVSLYDVGVDHGEYYIVMEYVDGPTLKDVIRERGPLAVDESIEIAKQICDALAHAHSHHIIHRDIKPHNILLTRSGVVKVTDFGIARAMTGDTITYQHATSVLGSVHYFSPEQARGGTTDVKSDIYSLGVVLYEMLTKQLPFSGDSPVSVALKHLRERFVDPRALNPEIPQSVENIILRCLVKSPDMRYPDMRSVKRDLETALDHPDEPKFIVPEEVSEETIAIPAVGLPAEEAASSAARASGRRWWSPLLWAVVVAGVLGVGAFAAYYIVMGLWQVPNVTLPNVVGMDKAAAKKKLEAAGFADSQIHFEYAHKDHPPRNIVYSQSPVGPTQVKKTRDIYLYVSQGPAQIEIPDLEDVPADQAKQQLVNLGFPAANITEQQVESPTFQAGVVAWSRPAPGTKVTPDAKIVLFVSIGPEVSVPDVIGKTLVEARQLLESNHLKVGHVYRAPSTEPDGLVFGVGPYTVNQQVPPGTAIDIYVSDNSQAGNAGIDNGTSANDTGAAGNAAIGNQAAGSALSGSAPSENATPGSAAGAGAGAAAGTSAETGGGTDLGAPGTTW